MDGNLGNLKASFHTIVLFECAAGRSTGSAAPVAGHDLPLGAAVKRVRVPCSGKLQPEHLLKAFEGGADIVVILTCRDGDCRYLEGRKRIERRLDYVRGLLDEIGLGGNRLVLRERALEENREEALEGLTASLSANPLRRTIDERAQVR